MFAYSTHYTDFISTTNSHQRFREYSSLSSDLALSTAIENSDYRSVEQLVDSGATTVVAVNRKRQSIVELAPSRIQHMLVIIAMVSKYIQSDFIIHVVRTNLRLELPFEAMDIIVNYLTPQEKRINLPISMPIIMYYATLVQAPCAANIIFNIAWLDDSLSLTNMSAATLSLTCQNSAQTKKFLTSQLYDWYQAQIKAALNIASLEELERQIQECPIINGTKFSRCISRCLLFRSTLTRELQTLIINRKENLQKQKLQQNRPALKYPVYPSIST